jgi:putative ABC transport system permease protein
MAALPLAFRLARRELRGGLKGFRVLVACLALGVAAIAAAGSLNEGLRATLQADARALLGGDTELRRSYRDFTLEERAVIETAGEPAYLVEMRAMAHKPGGKRSLVELKGVDRTYPLYGAVELDPPLPMEKALARANGAWGAAVDPGLLRRLDLKVGQRVEIGDIVFEIRAAIVKEPDRVATIFSLGPRVMVAGDAIAETGLVQPGSLVRYGALVRFNRDTTLASFTKLVTDSFPDAGWQIRKAGDAAPGIQRFLDNLTAFLTLVGLSALLIGGVGVANAIKAHIDGKLRTIAIFKCLGAPGGLVMRVYLIQIAMLALLGIAIGLVLGALLPIIAATLLQNLLPVPFRMSVYPLPLLIAAGFGALTATAFGLWPLARVRRVAAASLFRDLLVSSGRWPGWSTVAGTAAGAIGLAALAILSAENRTIATSFVVGASIALLLFWLLALAVARTAHGLARSQAGHGRPIWRLGLSNLHRPGAPTASVVLSFGLGLTVLVTVVTVQGNLAREIGERMPSEAPTFFFIDLQPDQVEPFDRLVAEADPSAKVIKANSVRGRVTRINGEAVDEEKLNPDVRWVVRGDRGLSTAATMPDKTRLIAGAWWPEDYQGETLVSLDANIARGFGLTVGESISVNVLGHEITAKIASLREIDWSSLGMNFTFILSPGALEGAPQTVIATVRADPAREGAVEDAVVAALPNVSSIRIKEALDAVKTMMQGTGTAVHAAAGIVLFTGALVLAGAIAAGQRRRTYEAVVLKSLGATRSDLWRAFLVEYGSLGIATGLFAGLFGSVAAWAILHYVMKVGWQILPLALAGTIGGCILAMLAIGFSGTGRALRATVAPQLRHE